MIRNLVYVAHLKPVDACRSIAVNRSVRSAGTRVTRLISWISFSRGDGRRAAHGSSRIRLRRACARSTRGGIASTHRLTGNFDLFPYVSSQLVDIPCERVISSYLAVRQYENATCRGAAQAAFYSVLSSLIRHRTVLRFHRTTVRRS